MRGALLVVMMALACKQDDPSKITAPDDPQTKVAPKTTEYPESPMVTAADGAKSIAPPNSVAKPPPDAFVTSTGLASKKLKSGTGTVHPTTTDNVKVHYSGWTVDGKMFDSSVARGPAVTFPLNALIKGWTEGLQLMVVGEQRRFWIPPDLAYGTGNPGRPSGTLVFDVELLEISARPK